jgi:branched-chain amino acid transport system permease protein
MDARTASSSAPAPLMAAPVPVAAWLSWRWLLVLAIAIGLPFAVSDYRLFQFSMALVYAVAVLGINTLTGYSGQISLGHSGFYAIGAYTAAVLMDRYGVPYWATIPPAAAITLASGYLFGLPARRLAGIYLALATFALGMATPQLLRYKGFEGLTGGAHGLVLNKPEPPAWLPVTQDQWLYFFVLAVAAVMFWLAHNLVTSRMGRAMMAIRDNPIAATAMGVDVPFHKAMTFGISAMLTGVAGALGAIVIQLVTPDSLGLWLAITLIVGAVVGGITSISGALWGGLFIVFVPHAAERISKAAPGVVYGVLLILLMFLLPQGVASLGRVIARLRQRR